MTLEAQSCAQYLFFFTGGDMMTIEGWLYFSVLVFGILEVLGICFLFNEQLKHFKKLTASILKLQKQLELEAEMPQN